MKRFISIIVFLGLFSATVSLPYTAQKKGVIIEAIDYGRNVAALCIDAPLSDMAKTYFGKGITGEMFIKNGLRPVGITITNTTDKPIMLAPVYSLKVTNGAGMINVMANNEVMGQIVAFSTIGAVAAYGALICIIIAVVSDHRDESAFAGTLASIFGTAAVGSFAFVIWKTLLAGEFTNAMQEKFEELNYKDETLLLPGKTIKKLFLTQNEAYISRFPVVLYPLENREDMIIFDVDLRA